MIEYRALTERNKKYQHIEEQLAAAQAENNQLKAQGIAPPAGGDPDPDADQERDQGRAPQGQERGPLRLRDAIVQRVPGIVLLGLDDGELFAQGVEQLLAIAFGLDARRLGPSRRVGGHAHGRLADLGLPGAGGGDGIGQQAPRSAFHIVHVHPAALALERGEGIQQHPREARQPLVVLPGAVLSQRFEAPFELPPFSLYRALRRVNPSPYLYFLDLGGFSIAGSSPEILVKVSGGTVTVRPIAGTRPRGATPHPADAGAA